MDQETYQAIRGQWLAERDEARETVKRLTAQVRDLDRVWKKIQPEPSGGPGRNGVHLRNGTLVAKVRAAVAGLPGEFESPQVWEAVIASNPGTADDQAFRANVANALKRLTDQGDIKLVEKGRGRAPARYRRIEAKEEEATPAEIDF